MGLRTKIKKKIFFHFSHFSTDAKMSKDIEKPKQKRDKTYDQHPMSLRTDRSYYQQPTRGVKKNP